jgi:hypothetical protein
MELNKGKDNLKMRAIPYFKLGNLKHIFCIEDIMFLLYARNFNAVLGRNFLILMLKMTK